MLERLMIHTSCTLVAALVALHVDIDERRR
jgi:hypothetical protein